MARGGARPGAGRKKGKALKITEHFTPAEIKEFIEFVKDAYKEDMRVLVWLGDHIYGKAPQPVTGEDGGPIKMEVVEVSFRQ